MTNINQIALLYVKDNKEDMYPGLRELAGKFRQVITVHKANITPNIESNLTIPFSSDFDLVEGLNEAYHSVSANWIFLLWSDEDVRITELENLDLNTKYCYPGLICSNIEDGRYNYDVRLIPVMKTSDRVFNGSTIPDLTGFIHNNKLRISDKNISINKEATFVKVEKLSYIANKKDCSTPMDWYWKGVYHTDQRQFKLAEKAFRSALKEDWLLSFYHLSALNGLANAQVELKKLKEAEKTVIQTLENEIFQFAPYLIQHKIHWLRGEWKCAYELLKKYLAFYQHGTRANMDFFLDLAQAHFLMAELSLVIKNRENAFKHFKQFYVLNNGNVSYRVLEKLFIYSIELEKKAEALLYFNNIFSKLISEQMSESDTNLVLEAASLFEAKGWDQIAYEVYEELFKVQPHNQSIIHRRLIALMRSNQIEKAKQVAAQLTAGD
ncbi:MAG: hypothetical protein WD491_01645 [Balneolales bacterium]